MFWMFVVALLAWVGLIVTLIRSVRAIQKQLRGEAGYLEMLSQWLYVGFSFGLAMWVTGQAIRNGGWTGFSAELGFLFMGGGIICALTGGVFRCVAAYQALRRNLAAPLDSPQQHEPDEGA